MIKKLNTEIDRGMLYPQKDAIEIIGWRYINEKGVDKLKRQAEREGGQILILSPGNGSAAALSALPYSLSQNKESTSICFRELRALAK
ncbi:MAG: hypothetical protein LBJ58_07305 [Tannerellaceae bacterium]|jgi:hypothetical protein|nr:hypothetical protein [Tannerellaceae bacterium]